MIRFLVLSIFLFTTCQTEAPEVSGSPHSNAPEYTKVPSKLGLIHQMQGRWKDSRIKGAELVITGNKFVSVYKEEVRSRATIEVFEKCPKKCCQGKPVVEGLGYFIVHHEDGDFCYVLQKLEKGILEYAPLDE